MCGSLNFAASFLIHAGSTGLMRLVRRDLKNGKYKVESCEVSKSSMQAHGDNIARAFQKAADVLNINDDDVDTYVEAIERHERGAFA
jgi:hypothetical protein